MKNPRKLALFLVVLSAMVLLGADVHSTQPLGGDQSRAGTLKWRFLTEAWVYSSPAIGEDGVIYIVSTGQEFFAIPGTDGGSLGLASFPWPMFHYDLRHTGRARGP